MAGDEDHTGGLGGVGAAEDGVDIADLCGFGDAGVGRSACWLGEGVALYFEAVVAGGGDGFEFGLDPVGGSVDPCVGGEIGVHAGEGAAVVEGDEFGDGGFDVVGRDLSECSGDGGVGWCGGDGEAGGKRLLRLENRWEKAGGEECDCEDARKDKPDGRCGCSGHEIFSLCKTEVPGESYA